MGELIATLVERNTGAVMAMRVLLTALIATHPNREALLETFQALLALEIDALQEQGFESGLKPELAAIQTAWMKPHADDWLALLAQK